MKRAFVSGYEGNISGVRGGGDTREVFPECEGGGGGYEGSISGVTGIVSVSTDMHLRNLSCP